MQLLHEQDVLVVDDEDMIREMLKSELEFLGASVDSAASVSEAMELLHSKKYLLVISDIRMPKILGTELLKNIRSIDRKKPLVLMMTGYTDVPLESLFDMGANGVIKKPFEFDLFFETVKHIIQSPDDRWTRQTLRLYPTKNISIKVSLSSSRVETFPVFNIGKG